MITLLHILRDLCFILLGDLDFTCLSLLGSVFLFQLHTDPYLMLSPLFFIYIHSTYTHAHTSSYWSLDIPLFQKNLLPIYVPELQSVDMEPGSFACSCYLLAITKALLSLNHAVQFQWLNSNSPAVLLQPCYWIYQIMGYFLHVSPFHIP